MDYDRMGFDEDETAAECDRELEFVEFDESDNDVEVQLLVARVRAARLAGA
jgi:hypothetical protein